MIQLLFAVLSAEVVVAVTLLFKTPLRKLVVLGLDRLKRGRGPVMVKTVAGTVLVVLASSLYSIAKISSGSAELGALTPTDQVLMSRHLLEASLMGYSLFLALIIDRLHHYVRELRGLRKSMEAVLKQNRVLEEAKTGGSTEVKALDGMIASLNEQINQLKSESEDRLQEAKAAEARAAALKKQSEDLLLEYDRLLEDNQNLRNQLNSIDNRLSFSDAKKIA
ncbi:B-cell receptor-associated protein 31-like [Musa troglodytarum]|uniref:Endoplasmic reticulum transmembrane protein n=1 Tax=Musa troglodytarum TaxID=320322 RepID=A0A9E7G8L1_9LILI|nr:B-cell receptor-associated protein 31-like [Musa troglodytarum]